MNQWLPFLLRNIAVLVALVVFLLHGMHVWRLPYLERLDAVIYDTRLLAQAQPAVHGEVLIVDIDEASLAAFCRWPWNRSTLAALTYQLTQVQQVAALGFDMVFAEAESPSSDLAFTQALAGQPVVLGYYFTSDRAGHTSGALPQPTFFPFTHKEQDFNIHNWSGYGGNLASLTAAAPQAGFFNAISGVDGLIRSAPLLTEYKGQYYESLALGLYRRYLAGTPAAGGILPSITPSLAAEAPMAQGDYRHVSHLTLTGPNWTKEIAVDDSVAMLVPFRGKGGKAGGSFTYLSAKDVLSGQLPAGSLKHKIVLIGSSAPALEDLRATPMGGAYPGVEVQANLIAALVDGRTPNRPDFAMGFELFELLCLGLLLLVLLPRLSAAWSMLMSVGLLVGLWLLHGFLHWQLGWVMPVAASLVFVFLTYVAHSSLGYLIEGQRRRRLIQLFGSYVSPRWVNQMVRTRQSYSMQATNQVLTVMFCDMRGFTRLAGQLEPLQLQALLNDIFSRLSQVIQDHGGTIDKYMGDCVMAFWGAPEPQADHAARAVRCALALQAAIRDYNLERDPDLPPVEMGIGLNTGLMCVGDMGSSIRRSYTVIGDAVNVASRLEGLCKTHNVPLIVSAATQQAAQEGEAGLDYGDPSARLAWIDLGSATIEGSDNVTHIYTL
jgi:adenylate cyclase